MAVSKCHMQRKRIYALRLKEATNFLPGFFTFFLGMKCIFLALVIWQGSTHTHTSSILIMHACKLQLDYLILRPNTELTREGPTERFTVLEPQIRRPTFQNDIKNRSTYFQALTWWNVWPGSNGVLDGVLISFICGPKNLFLTFHRTFSYRPDKHS